ncbi:MAG TPA: hypothetical protein VLM78_06620, partial [Anaerolineales bacterium]|nr:hypothetical protein [Anaerolineales bacterium]
IFALARFDILLPLRVLVLVSGAISAATGVLLFRLVKRTLSAPAAIFAASYWVFDRTIHFNVTMFGLETGLTALTMAAFLLAISRLSSLRGGSSSEAYQDPTKQSQTQHGLLRRSAARNDGSLTARQILTLSLLAVAMVFSRLDTIFLALLAGAWILLRGTPARTRLMLDAAIIVSAAFVSVALRTGLPQYFAYTHTAIIFAALGLILQIPIFYFLGLYDAPNLQIKNYVLRFIAASLLGSGVVAAGMIGLLVSDQLSGLPRSALLLYAGFVLAGAGLIRLAARRHPAQVQINWRQVFGEGVRYYGILGGALAAYMLFNKIVFGTFMPVSGQIKAWWGSLQGSTYGNPISTFSGFLGLEREEGLNTWGPSVYLLHDVKDWLGINLWLALGLMLAAVLLSLLTRPQRTARAAVSLGLPLLLTGSLVQLLYYNGQGYAGAKDWYWVSQMLMLPLLGALLFDLILRPLRKFQTGRAIAWGITAALCIGYYAFPFATVIIQRMTWGAERADQPYMDVLPFLESNTEEGALIGMTGGGNIGYFIEGRTIVNMDGLINSYAYYQSLRAGRGDEYMAGIGLDYIFSNPDILQNPPYNGQFDEWSENVDEFGKKDLLHYSPR